MDISFDDKEGKQFSQSEINQLKRDLNAEKFQNIYNIHNNSSEENKNNIEEEKNNDEEIKQNINKVININNNKITEENNVIHSDSEIFIKKEIAINNKNAEKNEESSKREESKEEEIHPDHEIIEQNNYTNLNQKKLIELIPLWFKCLNKDHGSKYISLDRKKENLICKNCYQSGALETNLDINQEFVDSYLKELEEKNNKTETSKDIIKETSEENITDKEDSSNKLNKDENETNTANMQYQIN
jgi:hypothetical protein